MGTPYYSERQFGLRPRVEEVISAAVWGGIIAIIESRVED